MATLKNWLRGFSAGRNARSSADTPLLDPEQRWAIACSALLSELNGWNHDQLHPNPEFPDPADWQEALEQWWSVRSKEGVLETFERLSTVGHRAQFLPRIGREVLAWDLCRIVSVARMAVGAGFLNAGDAWAQILPAARGLRERYSAWAELGGDYVLGHDLWAGQSDPDLVAAYRKLLDPQNASSPWQQIPWTASVQPNER